MALMIGRKDNIPVYSSEDKSLSVTASNITTVFGVKNGSYYFAGNGSTFTTNNGGKTNSTAETTLTALYDMHVIFTYTYGSEVDYDKFTLKVGDTVVANGVSGSGNKVYSGYLTTGQTIQFKYTKDGSNDYNGDKCTFSFSSLTYTVKTQTGSVEKELAHESKKMYIGDTSGKARKVVKAWIGDATGKARVCFSGALQLFVAAANAGGVAHSPDGVTWTLHSITLDGASTTAKVTSIAYGKETFAATIGAKLAWSEDGINFFTGTTATSDMRIDYGGGKFIAWFGGLNGSSECLYSVDGKTWTGIGISPSYTAATWYNVRTSYENGIWFTWGSQFYRWSDDGIIWNLVWGSSKVWYFNIVYAFGKWWRLGRNENGATEIAYSTNGRTGYTIMTHTGAVPYRPCSAEYGNDVIVMVGRGAPSGISGGASYAAQYMTSDAVIGTSNLSPIADYDSNLGHYRKVVFNKKFVTVGPLGHIPYSIDGKTWTDAQPLGNAHNIEDICYTVED